jgi:hypothetical protein
MPQIRYLNKHSVPEDGGLNRRFGSRSFSTFIKNTEALMFYHGGMFPLIWSDADYFAFDQFVNEYYFFLLIRSN